MAEDAFDKYLSEINKASEISCVDGVVARISILFGGEIVRTPRAHRVVVRDYKVIMCEMRAEE